MLPNAYMGRLYKNKIKIKMRIQIYKIRTVSKNDLLCKSEF